MSTDFNDLLPRDPNDTERAQRLVALGYPAVVPVLPELLLWLRDFDEPVARTLTPLFTRIGPPLAPFVRPILDSDDEVWKYGVLQQVAAKSVPLTRALTPDLLEMVVSPKVGVMTDELTALAKSLLTGVP